MAPAPLSDITVLDFSQSAAGPYTSQLLAEYGADVVAVEPPGGGQQRHLAGGIFFPNVSHNKRSIMVDLKNDDAGEIRDRLVTGADVLIHNYRGETASRLGIDYESVRTLNEGIVYCTVTGYGESGPYSERPAMDPNAQAVSGLMSMTGEPDRKPSRVGTSPVDFGTGMIGAFGIMTALHHRDRTGVGDKLEVSLLDTAAIFMGCWYTYYNMNGVVPERQGHTHSGYAPIGYFETATGPLYVTVPYENLWQRFCTLLDREDWRDDPRFDGAEKRLENRAELYEEIEAEFLKHDREALLEGLLEIGIPASKVQTIDEAATDEHLRHRGTITNTRDSDGEDVLFAARPVKTGTELPEITRPPELGEQTSSILDGLGFDDDEIAELYSSEAVE